MKKQIFLPLKVSFIVVLFIFFQACKKDEVQDTPDPVPTNASSVKEETLKGVWNLASGVETGTSGTTYVVTYTGTMATISFSGQTNAYSYTEKLEFLNNDVFKCTIIEDGDLAISEGYWAFMNGYNGIADYDMLVIRLSSQTSGGSTSTWAGDEMPVYILRFSKFTGNEIIIVSDGTSVVGGSTSSFSSSKTYIKNP